MSAAFVQLAAAARGAPFAAAGTFVVTDLVPDTYRVTVSGDPISESSWWLRAAMFDGRDLLDVPLRVSAGEDLRGIQLVLSDRRSELSGMLTTAVGDAFPEVFVLACPADRTLRLPNSRRVQAVRPDSSGRFVFENLPAGDYLLFALTDIDDGQWNDPGFFDAMPGASVRLTLAHGGEEDSGSARGPMSRLRASLFGCDPGERRSTRTGHNGRFESTHRGRPA